MLARLILVLFVSAFLFSQAAWCGPLLYARELPTACLNIAAGCDGRSNWTWYDSNGDIDVAGAAYLGRWLQGDTFTAGGSWVIDTIVTYSVASVGTDDPADFAAEFRSVALYTGPASPYGGMDLRLSGLINSDGTSNNLNITHERAYYNNDTGQDGHYNNGDSPWLPLWKTTFGNLNWTVSSGVEYFFAVDGAPRIADATGRYGLWYNHFTDYDWAEEDRAEGADSQYWIFYNVQPMSVAGSLYPLGTETTPSRPLGVDMNVEIYGAEIPEPASVFLVALGGIFLIARRAKRRLV